MRKALLASAALAAIAMFPAGGVFADAGPSEDILVSLRERQQALSDSTRAIVAAADDRGEDLTEEELAEIEANAAEAEKLATQIKARETAAKVNGAGVGRRTAAEPVAAGRQPAGSGARVLQNGRDGFRSFGEFAMSVRGHARGNMESEGVRKLVASATTYGNEGTGADGGFAVPQTFRTEIWQKVMAEENLLGRCSQLVTGSNNLTVPQDNTAPWDTTNGIQAYWEAEAATVAGSKPALGTMNMRLNKLMALVPVSDELLEDAVGLESWLRAKAPAKMASKLNTAIIRGTGVGQPLGILNSPALVSITKETSQVADTIYFANITKMWSRMYGPCRRNGVWLINQDIEPQLLAMAFDPDATTKIPVYLPANGLSDSPYASLMGRPVVPCESCSTVGDQGDIIFADLSQYWALTKGGDVRTDVSMHLYFDQGLQAFRFTFRVTGQPSWGASLTPKNGNNTLSCFVALDARA